MNCLQDPEHKLARRLHPLCLSQHIIYVARIQFFELKFISITSGITRRCPGFKQVKYSLSVLASDCYLRYFLC
jgi:hypothetical protein